MGADGHVTILDWSKIKARFPERGEEWLMECFGRQTYVYPNPFREGEVLVFYWDNYNHCDTNIPVHLWDGSPAYPDSKEEYEERLRDIHGFSPAELEGRWEVFKWSMENALIAVWEVWT